MSRASQKETGADQSMRKGIGADRSTSRRIGIIQPPCLLRSRLPVSGARDCSSFDDGDRLSILSLTGVGLGCGCGHGKLAGIWGSQGDTPHTDLSFP